MYCYNCGNLVYNGMSKCLICGSDTQIIHELIFDSAIEKIAENIPDLDNTEKVFKIGENTIKIPKENIFAVILNKFSSCIFETSWNELLEWINCKSFDCILDKGKEKLGSLMDATELTAVALMKKMGCNVGSNTAKQTFASVRESTLVLQDTFYELEMLKEQLENIKDSSYEKIKKNYTTPKSSHWSGGGFGIAGAVKGQITAGIMNLGETALMGIANSIGSYAAKSSIDNYINKAKNEVQSSPLFQLYFKKIWHDHFKSFYATLKRKIASELKIENLNAGYNWGNDLECDLSVCDEQSAINKLNANIYDLNAYISLYSINRKYGKELCSIADYCGILDIVESAFLEHVDEKVIANLDINKLGYDLSYEKLEALKKDIDDMEDNNSIFQHLHTDTFDIMAKEFSNEFNNLSCEGLEAFKKSIGKQEENKSNYQHLYLKLLVMKEQEYSKKLNELCSSVGITKNKDSVRVKIETEKICKLENICSSNLDILSEIILFINSVSERQNIYEIATLKNQLYNIFQHIKVQEENLFKFFIDYFVDNATEFSSCILLECVLGWECLINIDFINASGIINQDKLEFVEKAAKNGNIFAMSIIGDFYMKTDREILPFGKTKETGKKYIENAAKGMEITALKEIGSWYGYGTNNYPKDKKRAEQYLLLSKEMGCKDAENIMLKLQEK